MSLTKIYTAFAVLLCLPLFAFSQVHERGMMKNRTNVEKESSDYTLGIFRDTNQYRNLLEFGTYGEDASVHSSLGAEQNQTDRGDQSVGQQCLSHHDHDGN